MRVFNEVIGEYLDVPSNPRIVSLAPSNTDIIYQLDLWDNLIGISYYCRIPDGMDNKPRIGSYLNVNYRKLDELSPDIIFTTTGIQRKLSIDLWERGYPVYPVQLPLSIYGILENIMVIAGVLNLTEKGYEKTWHYLEMLYKIPRVRKRLKVYYEIDLGGPITIGSLSYINSSIHIMGLENIFGEEPRSYFKPDMSVVAMKNPELIIYEKSGNNRMDIDKLLKLFKDRGWENVKAVKDKNILILPPDSLAHYGPSHIPTLWDIAAKINDLL